MNSYNAHQNVADCDVLYEDQTGFIKFDCLTANCSKKDDGVSNQTSEQNEGTPGYQKISLCDVLYIEFGGESLIMTGGESCIEFGERKVSCSDAHVRLENFTTLR